MDLVSKDAALLLEEKDLNGDDLLRMVEKLLDDKIFVKNLKNNLKQFEVKNSASIIYDEIVKIVSKGEVNEKNN